MSVMMHFSFTCNICTDVVRAKDGPSIGLYNIVILVEIPDVFVPTRTDSTDIASLTLSYRITLVFIIGVI